MKRYGTFLIAFFGIAFIFTKQALAVCPLCTVAVGAGIGASRWLGIDDSITGLWIGGLTVSLVSWTLEWFVKKDIRFRARTLITTLGYYALIVLPLYFMGLAGNPANAVGSIGIDKLILGVIIGSTGFYFGASWYFFLKKRNGGRAHFPFQKVVMPIAPLILASIIFYFVA